jgi:hypothetical protein
LEILDRKIYVEAEMGGGGGEGGRSEEAHRHIETC